MSMERPLILDETIIPFLLVKTRRRRTLRSYQRLLQLNERKLKPAVNEWLDFMVKELKVGLSRMRGKTPAAKTKSLADWKEIRARGEELMKPALYEALAAGGNSVMGQKIRKQERFDPIGIGAVKWTTKHSAELVTEITDETMLAIREYIKAGVKEGKSVHKIAMELRPLVGLTKKQIFAVANYHEMVILDRPEYTAARQREMADVYARRLHRRRAALIARTETAKALKEGIVEGYSQMNVKRLEGVSDPEACDWCMDNIDGKIYTLEEARSINDEAHPGCECAWVAA